jgi:hypothetical protein
MMEWQFGGLEQEVEERLLLPFLGDKRHTRMAAERAAFEDPPSAPPQPVHAGIAENFVAVCALMRGACVGMPGAENGAIRHDHRRSGPRHVELGDFDGNIGSLDQQLDLSKMHGLAGGQPGFLDAFAVYEGAVGGCTVAHHDSLVSELDLAMQFRHGRMLNLNITIRVAPDLVNTQVKLNYPVSELGGLND